MFYLISLITVNKRPGRLFKNQLLGGRLNRNGKISNGNKKCQKSELFTNKNSRISHKICSFPFVGISDQFLVGV